MILCTWEIQRLISIKMWGSGRINTALNLDGFKSQTWKIPHAQLLWATSGGFHIAKQSSLLISLSQTYLAETKNMVAWILQGKTSSSLQQVKTPGNMLAWLNFITQQPNLKWGLITLIVKIVAIALTFILLKKMIQNRLNRVESTCILKWENGLTKMMIKNKISLNLCNERAR